MATQSKNKTPYSLPARLKIDLLFVGGMMEQCYLKELLVKDTRWLQSEEFEDWFAYDLILNLIGRYGSSIRRDINTWLSNQDIEYNSY